MNYKLFEDCQKQIKEIRDFYKKDKNIFRILHLEEQEIRHSRFIAWLLDNEVDHGLKDSFLRFILKETYDVDFGAAEIEYDVNVEDRIISTLQNDEEGGEEPKTAKKGKKGKKENDTQRPVDIVVVEKKNKKFVLTIENKYRSVVHDDQCADYIRGIKNKYPGCKKYYFVFLDIRKPDDYETKPENYGTKDEKFIFISYEKVRDELNDYIFKNPRVKDREAKRYIMQYLDVLIKEYAPLEKELRKICEELDPDVVADIANINTATREYKEKLSGDEQRFVKIVQEYYKENKDENDKKVKNILEEYVLNEEGRKIINSSYGHGKKTEDSIPYAYAVNIPEEFLDELEGVKRTFSSVDYDASKGLQIKIIAGFTAEPSRNLLSYIKDTSNFWGRVKKLQNEGWVVRPVFGIKSGRGEGKNVYELFLDSDPEKTDTLTKFLTIDKLDYIGKIISKEKKNSTYVKKLTDYVNGLFEYVTEMKAYKNVYRDTDIIEEGKPEVMTYLKNKRSATTVLILSLSYPLNIDGNPEDIAETFKDKTKEALNLFGDKFGDKFAENYFLKPRIHN